PSARRGAPDEIRAGRQHDADAGAHHGREAAAVYRDVVDPRAGREPRPAEALLALAVRRELGLGVVAENVAGHAGACALRADRRCDDAFVGARERPAAVRVDPERLVGLTAVVAGAAGAPDQGRLVLIARPRSGGRDAGRSVGAPLSLACRLPVVAPVLLAVAVRVPAARREARAERIGAVGSRHVDPLFGTRVVAEPPGLLRWLRATARPRAHARVDTGFDVAREHVHDPAERRGAVQRRACPFHDLHALHVLERDQVPVDAAAVALVRGDAVHQQEHARAEALHVAGRAADVHLAVQELHAG